MPPIANLFFFTGPSPGSTGTVVKLSDTVLGAPATVITVSGFTAQRNLLVIFMGKTAQANVTLTATLNNDSGANYATNKFTATWTNSGGTSQTGIPFNTNGTSGTKTLIAMQILNDQVADQKVGFISQVDDGAAGAAAAPNFALLQFKWANTAAQITIVDITSNVASGIGTNSVLAVYAYE